MCNMYCALTGSLLMNSDPAFIGGRRLLETRRLLEVLRYVDFNAATPSGRRIAPL